VAPCEVGEDARPLLPSLPSGRAQRATLVVDLDETLVHTTFDVRASSPK